VGEHTLSKTSVVDPDPKIADLLDTDPDPVPVRATGSLLIIKDLNKFEKRSLTFYNTVPTIFNDLLPV
jgi:hypothetical protein